MEPVEFTEPSGDDITAPTLEQVIERMRLGDDYWGPYSPMGWLKRGNPPSSQLVIIRHPRRGWYLEYEAAGPPPRRVVAAAPGGRLGNWVEHWHEGQTSFFPASSFLPQAFAEQAVAAFLDGRDPSETGLWEPFRWDTHKREVPPPDGLLQRLLGLRRVIERAEPTA